MQAYPLLHTVSGPPRLLHAPGAVLCDCFNPAVALDKPLEFEGVATTYGGLLKTEPSAKAFKVINTQVLKWPAAINPMPRWPYMKLVEAYNNDFFCELPRLEAFFDAIEHYKAWCKEYHTVNAYNIEWGAADAAQWARFIRIRYPNEPTRQAYNHTTIKFAHSLTLFWQSGDEMFAKLGDENGRVNLTAFFFLHDCLREFYSAHPTTEPVAPNLAGGPSRAPENREATGSAGEPSRTPENGEKADNVEVVASEVTTVPVDYMDITPEPTPENGGKAGNAGLMASEALRALLSLDAAGEPSRAPENGDKVGNAEVVTSKATTVPVEYIQMTRDDLRKEAKRRGLQVSGFKDGLVKRLEDDDKKSQRQTPTLLH